MSARLLLILLFLSPFATNAQTRGFKQSLLDEPYYKEKTTKIYSSLDMDPLQPDTVFFYAAQLLLDLQEEKLGPEQQVDTYNTIGKMFSQLNALDLGHQYLLKALETYRYYNFGASRYLIHLYGLIAASFSNSPANDEITLSYYRKAYRLSQKLGEKLYVAGNLNNMGMQYSAMGQLDSALNYYHRAMDVYTNEYDGFNGLELAIRNNMAEAYLRLADYEKALELYGKNLYLANESKLLNNDQKRKRRVSASLGMAGAYLNTGNYRQAEELVRFADSIIPMLTFRMIERFSTLSYKIKVDILSHYSNNAALAQASKDYLSLKDSLNDLKLQVVNRFADAMAQSQLDIINLQFEAQNHKLSESRFRYSLILAGLLIVILVLTIVFLYTRKRNQRIKTNEKLAQVTLQNSLLQEEKLKLQLRHQAQDLNELSGQMMFVRELNQQIVEKLKGIDKLGIEDQKNVLVDLSRLTKRNLNEINVKGKLQENLQKVNSSFYRKLDEASESLISSGEKEIAALLRLGISDSQISELRGTSVNAVRVARFRIKQKLHLAKSQNLTQYLVEL